MTLAQEITIPHVKVEVRAGGTYRPLFVPIYEAPLLERMFAQRGEVVVMPLPAVGPRERPWPADMRQRLASCAGEEQRLRAKYAKHPITKEPIFDAVYGFGKFTEAFQRAASNQWRPPGEAPVQEAAVEPDPEPTPEPLPEPEPAPEGKLEAKPWAALIPIDGLGDDFAETLFNDGHETIADVASMSLEELEAYPGIAKKSGQRILDSASTLVLKALEAEGN